MCPTTRLLSLRAKRRSIGRRQSPARLPRKRRNRPRRRGGCTAALTNPDYELRAPEPRANLSSGDRLSPSRPPASQGNQRLAVGGRIAFTRARSTANENYRNDPTGGRQPARAVGRRTALLPA